MADFDYSTFNVFDILYHLQKGTSSVSPFPEGPATLHVYGAFLFNAWRKRNFELRRAKKKLEKIKNNCFSSEEKLNNLNASIAKVEDENHFVFSTLISLQDDLLIAQKTLQALKRSSKKKKEDRNEIYDKIESSMRLTEEKRKKVKAVEEQISKVLADQDNLKYEFGKILTNVENTMAETEAIQNSIDATKEIMTGYLDELKFDAEDKAKVLMIEINTFSEISDEYNATKDRIDELMNIIAEFEAEKEMRQRILESEPLPKEKAPWLWNSLRDILGSVVGR